jgi:O-Antigen ligase/Tetratricopeptide repeat
LAVWLLVLTVLSAGSALALHLAERRVQVSPVVRRIYATAVVIAVVGLLAIGLVTGGGPAHIARHSYDRFLANPVANSDLNRRIFQLSSNGRVALWHIAWRQFARHAITGTGAGTYEPYWYEHRGSNTQAVRDAHSLYIETLGELGIPGAALLLGMVLVPFAGLSVRRRPLVALALGAYTCLLVHAISDWDWELPAVMLAGTWCGLATLVERRGYAQPVRVGIRGRAVLAAAAFVLAAFAFVGLVGNLALSSGWDAFRAGNLTSSGRDARKAAGWAPWASEPWLLLAATELGQGQQAAARIALREAIDRQPRDFGIWQQLALITRGREHRLALLRARQLNPQVSP